MTATDSSTLASDQEREGVTKRLAEAFAEGRIDQNEHESRVDRALKARTQQGLDAALEGIVADVQATNTSGLEQGTSLDPLPVSNVHRPNLPKRRVVGKRHNSLSENQQAILEGIYQHRVLTTPQIRTLYKPATTSPRSTEKVLEKMRDCDPPLLQIVATPDRAPTNLHFLTRHGIKVVQSGKPSEQRKQFGVALTPELAGGPLQPHSIGVNDVGIAFVEAARARGDGCGPLDWHHEVSHVISPARGRGGRDSETVRADALLHYTLRRDDKVFPLARFIEFDRGTMGARNLAAKARSYARLWAYRPEGSSEPGWKRTYTWEFPEVLIVFAGLSRRKELEERLHDTLAFIRADPEVQRVPALVVSCVLLSDLRERGPFAKVLHRHDTPGSAVDWLGES